MTLVRLTELLLHPLRTHLKVLQWLLNIIKLLIIAKNPVNASNGDCAAAAWETRCHWRQRGIRPGLQVARGFGYYLRAELVGRGRGDACGSSSSDQQSVRARPWFWKPLPSSWAGRDLKMK